MPNNIIQLNEEVVKSELKELVKKRAQRQNSWVKNRKRACANWKNRLEYSYHNSI